MKFRIPRDPDYKLEAKVGSFHVEYGVRGQELEKEVNDRTEQFVTAMETRGNKLYVYPGLQNPKWVTSEDGELTAYYAIDWEGTRKPELAPDGLPLPRTRETSLEETEGEVEYRIIGVFWIPQVEIPILKSIYEIREDEKLAKNPLQSGYGGVVIPSKTITKEYE